MDGMTSDPPFLFWSFKGDLTRIAYAKFHGVLIVGYFINEFKWFLNFRCHCQLVEYPNMPLTQISVTLNAWSLSVGSKQGSLITC